MSAEELNYIESFRREQSELFDEDGNFYTGVRISARQCELMLKAIDELEQTQTEREHKLYEALENLLKIAELRVIAANEVISETSDPYEVTIQKAVLLGYEHILNDIKQTLNECKPRE